MQAAGGRFPRCSIIMPAYNCEAYVADAVRSVLDQTFADRELVVVNDGSTDGTAVALEPFMSDMVYVEQPHRGVSAARNQGLAVAGGELIAFLDADDAWSPSWLETMIRCLDSRDDVDFVTLWRPRHAVRFRRFRPTNQGFWITQYNFIGYMSVLPRHLLDEYGGFDEDLPAFVDWELWIRLFGNGVRAGTCQSAPVLHRRLPGSITADRDKNMLSERRMFERIVEKNGIGRLGPRLAVARGKAALAEADVRAARRHFAAAIFDRAPLAWWLRLLAVPCAIAPGLARRVHVLVVRRHRRRHVLFAKRAAERVRSAYNGYT